MTTETEIEILEQRLRERRWMSQVPQPAPLSGRELEIHQAQEAKRLARVAAAEAEEARQRAERDAENERRAREWEANAPLREQAGAELARILPELGRLDQERDQLAARRRELERVLR